MTEFFGLLHEETRSAFTYVKADSPEEAKAKYQRENKTASLNSQGRLLRSRDIVFPLENTVEGDILSAADDPLGRYVLVCHQVNCKGVMGLGLAKQIRERYPQVYAEYKKRCRSVDQSSDLLGSVQTISLIKQAGYAVVNIFGQDSYGRNGVYTDYGALRNAFSALASVVSGAVIRIPYKMGCGLGGGHWPTVLQIIRETLCPYCEVEIWEKIN